MEEFRLYLDSYFPKKDLKYVNTFDSEQYIFFDGHGVAFDMSLYLNKNNIFGLNIDDGKHNGYFILEENAEWISLIESDSNLLKAYLYGVNFGDVNNISLDYDGMENMIYFMLRGRKNLKI